MKNIWTYLTILTVCLFFSIDAEADTTLYVHAQGTLVNVREGPGIDFPVIMKLGNGTKVIEKSRQENWVAVKVAGWNKIGWIHSTLLKREKIEDSNNSPSTKVDDTIREASRSPAVSVRSKATERPEKAAISPEPVSGKYLYAKIGVVDIQKIIFDSKMGKAARKYIQDPKLLKSEEDLARTKKNLVNQIIKDAEVIINKYAIERGFSLIIRKQAVLFSVKVRFDITDDIIRIYDEQVEALKSKKSG
ncbi:MAG: OmpH family outer membrane protein [Desulfobacterales bacterium]